MPDLTPEQLARQQIDAQLIASGWVVQDKKAINFSAGPGIAVREYQTDVGPADYVLFVDKQAVGVIEAKKEEVGQNITVVENQTAGYATAQLKWIKNHQPPRVRRRHNRRSCCQSRRVPDPKDLAEDIVENIEAGLNNFRAVVAALGK
jgi:type I site-specific restriction endonuclease